MNDGTIGDSFLEGLNIPRPVLEDRRSRRYREWEYGRTQTSH